MQLSEALDLGEREVVAFVGGGGKTACTYRLVREAVAMGRRAIASGTARFSMPETGVAGPVVAEADTSRLVQLVGRQLESGTPWLIAASTGDGPPDRLVPLDLDAVDALASLPEVGLIALEADGSRMRPFKAPAEHEPPVPPCTTLLVALAGANVLGLKLDETSTHRPERVMALTGAVLGDEITPALVASVLAHEQGGRRNLPPAARYAVVLNKVSDQNLEAARETARLLIASGVERVVLARALEEPPVVEVFRA